MKSIAHSQPRGKQPIPFIRFWKHLPKKTIARVNCIMQLTLAKYFRTKNDFVLNRNSVIFPKQVKIPFTKSKKNEKCTLKIYIYIISTNFVITFSKTWEHSVHYMVYNVSQKRCDHIVTYSKHIHTFVKFSNLFFFHQYNIYISYFVKYENVLYIFDYSVY